MFHRIYKFCSRTNNDENDETSLSGLNLLESEIVSSSTVIGSSPFGLDNVAHYSKNHSNDESVHFRESKLLHEAILSQAKLWMQAGRCESESDNFDVALNYFEKAISLVDRTEKFYQLETIYCDIAMTYIRKARFIMATKGMDKEIVFDCLEHAEKYLPDELGVPEYEEKFPQIFEELAQIYSGFGDYRKALTNYTKRVKAAEFLNNYSELALQAEIDLARCYDTLNNFKKSVKHFENAYGLAVRLNRMRIKSEISCELGYQFFMNQDYSSAKIHFQKFYVFSEKLENYQEQAKAAWYLSKIYLNLKDLDNAEKYAKIQLGLAQSIEDEGEIAVANQTLRDIPSLRNEKYFKCNLSGTSNDQKHSSIPEFGLCKSAELCLELGELFYTDNDYTTAKHFFAKLYEITGLNRNTLEQAKACWYLSKINLEMEDYNMAWQYAFEQVQLAKEVNNKMELDSAETNMKAINELIKKQEDK